MKNDILSLLKSAGGPGIIYVNEVRKMLSNMAKKLGGKKALADEFKVSAQFMGDVILGRRAPSVKILEPLGLEAITIYVQKKSRDAKKKTG